MALRCAPGFVQSGAAELDVRLQATLASLPATHHIREISPGVFWTLLEPCSCRVLPHVLHHDPASVVWLVQYQPLFGAWTDLTVPLSTADAPELLRVRGVEFDIQLSLEHFLARLPAMHARSGMRLLQMSRPVADSLSYVKLEKNPDLYAILRQNGWLLTFDLPHDGEYAELRSSDRTLLERVLADPVIASRDLP